MSGLFFERVERGLIGVHPDVAQVSWKAAHGGKQALRVLLQIFPDIPLLYRWKGWEPCLFYCIRGCVVHGFLQFALTHSANVDTVNKLESLDEDSPDMSFSLKQEVRLSKAIKVFNSESIYATCICFDLSAVL